MGAATSFVGAQAGKIVGPALARLGSNIGGWFKKGFQTYAKESIQTILINGKPVTTSIEVGIKATKIYVAKALGGSVGNAVKGGTEALSSLKPTHYLTRSKTQMQTLVNDIRENGIKDAIEYVEFNGQKYIVGGNHRYFAAQKLGIQNVPVKQVQLPFAGYKTSTDLMLEGRMPGYWRYIK